MFFFLDIVLVEYLYLTKEFDKAKAGASKSTPPISKGMNKFKIFAPASPAFSSKVAGLSSTARKTSLRASDTGINVA